MIVCQCNFVTAAEIEKCVRTLLRDDPWIQLTPGAVYHALGVQGECCGCFPNVIDIIVQVANEEREMLAKANLGPVSEMVDVSS